MLEDGLGEARYWCLAACSRSVSGRIYIHGRGASKGGMRHKFPYGLAITPTLAWHFEQHSSAPQKLLIS
jgi:hypothetical protein